MILVMSETLPLAEVKAKFSEMIDRVEQQHDRITVTRNGRPAAVLMSPDDLASLEDTLELLSNPDVVAEIELARREVAAGTIVSAEQLRIKYLGH
jgi:prevent-host-death family protein